MPTVKIGAGCKGGGTKRDKIIKGQGHWNRGQDARQAAAAGWALGQYALHAKKK